MKTLALRISFVLAVPFTALACSSSDGSSGDRGDEIHVRNQAEDGGSPAFPSGATGAEAGVSCTVDAECQKGSTCVTTHQGEFTTGVCVPAGAGSDAPHTYRYTSWSELGSCSRTCGGGTQERTRQCQRDDGVTVACSFCGGDCSESQPCNPQACVTCPSETFQVPTASGGTCTATVQATNAGNSSTSYAGNPGFTGPNCSAGNRQGGHTGTLTGGTYGTCSFYCDVIAKCDETGHWTDVGYTW